ncbi:MAG: hypothetical protein LBC62_05965 [Treponema sp.]|jgi:hypothetical protein|nr:hypothetical protein [Treponema sp.]
MNDLEPSGTALAKQGVAAAGGIAGGVLLLVMQILGARFRLVGILLGLIVGGVGVSGLLSRDPEDKKPGLILTAAGALELVFQFGIPVLKPIAGTILGFAALGLLAAGIWKGIRFLKGLRSRQ